jgi:hypothetical protein
MTTIALPERLGFGSIDWANYAYLLERLSGLDDAPPLRGADQPWAGLPGQRSLNALYDSRTFDASLLVFPRDVSGTTTGTNAQQARTNLDALKAAFALSTATVQAVTRVMPDGTTRTAYGRVITSPTVDLTGKGELFRVTPRILLPDPFFYTAPVTSAAEVFSTSPHTWALNNPGNVKGYNLQFDILGPATNVRITNLGNGSYVDVPGSVAATKHLLIDCLAFTVTNDGAKVIPSHAGAVPFLILDPGTNSLQATATGLSGATRITPTFTAPYL